MTVLAPGTDAVCAEIDEPACRQGKNSNHDTNIAIVRIVAVSSVDLESNEGHE